MKSLLIVDDDLESLDILQDMLEETEYDIKMFSDSTGVIEFLETTDKTFDLILTDWVMPNVSGLDLLKRIKDEKSDFKNVPVVIITARALKSDVATVNALGAAYYLPKPFSEEDLFEVIKKYMTPDEL